jgi:hypothetical protein
MKRTITLASILAASIFLSGCTVQEVRTQTPIDPKHPWVVQLPQEMVQGQDCTTIWICSFVNVTASTSCEHLVFDFEIVDAATRETVVSRARSYWGYLPQGLTQVEYGFNNPIFQSTAFSKPVATCLDSEPGPAVLSSMQDFDSSFCTGDWPEPCSSSSVSGWEIENLYGTKFPADIKNSLIPSQTYDVPSDFSISGYTVICEDGWVSQSGGKQGACSGHGGIAD